MPEGPHTVAGRVRKTLGGQQAIEDDCEEAGRDALLTDMAPPLAPAIVSLNSAPKSGRPSRIARAKRLTSPVVVGIIGLPSLS
jgi:hypothetical protein